MGTTTKLLVACQIAGLLGRFPVDPAIGMTGAPRSRPLIRQFATQTGYPNGRPGWVVDHQIPLCAGGPDVLANLQWQERTASYVKDVFERELCKDMKRLQLSPMTATLPRLP